MFTRKRLTRGFPLCNTVRDFISPPARPLELYSLWFLEGSFTD